MLLAVMIHTMQQVNNIFVFDIIKHILSIPPVFKNPFILHQNQMLAYHGLGISQPIDNGTYAKFFIFKKFYNFQPDRMSNGL